MLKSNTIVPLYEQLKQKLKGEIDAGIYKPGDKLPPELEMAKQNNVSVITARKAVNDLASEGIVEKKQGKGTFVAVPKYGRDYTRITSFSDSCMAMGLRAGSVLLEQKVLVPEPHILEQLELSERSSAVFISRLRTVNDEPMAIEKSYFSMEYAFLLNETLEGSLFDVLREKRNVQVVKSKKRIEICRATAQEAKLLNLRKNNPLLLVKSVALSADNTPIYVGVQLINGERFTLCI